MSEPAEIVTDYSIVCAKCMQPTNPTLIFKNVEALEEDPSFGITQSVRRVNRVRVDLAICEPCLRETVKWYDSLEGLSDEGEHQPRY